MPSYKLHKINGYISNIYLAEYNDKILLLDCGTKNDVKRIKNFCEQTLHRSVKDIKLAVVTHNHPDHAGGADLLRKFHGIPLASGKGIDLWYKGFSGFIQHKIDCVLAHIVRNANKKKIESVMSKRYVRPDYILNDNETIPGFSDWRTIYVPGHTLHDIVLYNKDNRLLYSSDCIININGRYNLPIPVFFPFTMKQSFQKLMKLKIKTLIPAHGDIIETDDSVNEFEKMINLLGIPASKMSKKIHRISFFTPEVWKAYLKKMKRKYKTGF